MAQPDPKALKAAAEERERRKQAMEQLFSQAMAKVAASQEGKLVLARIYAECEADKSELILNGSQMYWEGGKRSIGIFVKAMVKRALPLGWMQVVEQCERLEGFYLNADEGSVTAFTAMMKEVGNA